MTSGLAGRQPERKWAELGGPPSGQNQVNNEGRECSVKIFLILGSFLPDNASVINDYFLSFQKYSRHRFFYMTRLEEWDVGFDFNRFDALLLFWSCAWFALDLPTQLLESMAGARGAKY